MSEVTSRLLVVLTRQMLWFLGQATIFYLFWNFALTAAFSVPDLGPVQSIAIFALLRVIVDPPKLRLEFD